MMVTLIPVAIVPDVKNLLLPKRSGVGFQKVLFLYRQLDQYTISTKWQNDQDRDFRLGNDTI